MKDKDGIVLSSLVGLADRAKVTIPECEGAIAKFLASDPHDTSKVEEGRRLRAVPGGWQVVNHDHYRFSTEARREVWKQQKAEERELKKLKVAKIDEEAAIKAGAHSRHGKKGKEL